MSDRYARQCILPEVGAAGQARLGAATVVVVGAGGLGCAVLQYLTAAGVGRLMIVDHDRVEESNLHRQPLYRMTDLGRPKVQAARAALVEANPEVRIDTLEERLTAANAARLVAMADVVIALRQRFVDVFGPVKARLPELVAGVQRHAQEVHQMTGVTREQVLAQAKPV